MGFQQGLSGLNAASKNLDVIGNNVANVNTVGFKVSTAQFADVYANSLTGAGGLQIGLGTKVQGVAQEFSQGNLTATNNPLDMAINGGGFFILGDQGATVYSRNGQFHMDAQGNIVSPTGMNLKGFAVDSAGNVLNGVLTNLQISSSQLSLNPAATTNVAATLNLDSRNQVPSVTPFDYTNPATYNSSTSSTIYDSLGNEHTYSMYFVKTSANNWNVYATLTQAGTGTTIDLSSGGTVPLGSLTFSTAGALTTAMPLPAQNITAAQLGTGAAAMSFTVNYKGSTQYGGPFAVSGMTPDGSSPGNLTKFTIGSDGIIQGSYSNGKTRNLGQVALTTFRNPNGLQPLGNNVWSQTSDSGLPIPQTGGAPGTGNLGVLQSSSVEDSNIDLTAELVNMITAQRAYQANSQTIKTQDSVMQTLVNMR